MRDVMTPDLIYCREDEEVERAAGKMQVSRIRRLLVVDDQLRLVGIVSLGDLALHDPDGELSAKTLGKVSEPAPLAE